MIVGAFKEHVIDIVYSHSSDCFDALTQIKVCS